MTKQERDRLKNLVANNKIDQVFKRLLEHNLEEDDHSEVIVLQARYNQLQKESRLAILSTENQNLQRNQIHTSLLNLINKIDGTNNGDKIVERKRAGIKSNRLIVMLGVLGSLASIFSLLLMCNTDKDKQLTIFVTDFNGNVVLENEGELNIPIGNRILNRPIETNGRTNFADIISDNIGDSITIGLKAEGWEIEGSNKFKFEGKPITLIVKRKGSVMKKNGQSLIDSIGANTYEDTNKSTKTPSVPKKTVYFDPTQHYDIAILSKSKKSNIENLLKSHFKSKGFKSSSSVFNSAFKSSSYFRNLEDDASGLKAIGLDKAANCICLIDENIRYEQKEKFGTSYLKATGSYSFSIIDIKSGEIDNYTIETMGSGTSEGLAKDSVHEHLLENEKFKNINIDQCKN